MNTCKVLLRGALLALTVSSSVQAVTVSTPVSNMSNLWYYSQVDHELGFSPDAGGTGVGSYREGGRSTTDFDYWDNRGSAASEVSGSDFVSGSLLTLSIDGAVPFNSTFGDIDANGLSNTFTDLFVSSVVGVWAEAVGTDGSFTALDLDAGSGTLFDFNVGSSFSQIIPDNAVALFLGYVSPDTHDAVTAESSLYREFSVTANVTAVPIPAGIWLLATGLLMFGGRKMVLNRELSSA